MPVIYRESSRFTEMLIMKYEVDMDGKKMTRRSFIGITAATAAGSVTVPALIGCGPVETGPATLAMAGIENSPASKKAFEAAVIGPVRLKNRIIRSAVSMNGIDDAGRPSEALLGHYADIARGGAGAIITGMLDTGMMIDDFRYKDEHFSSYKKVPDVIHSYDVPAIQQISHRGRQKNLDESGDFFVNEVNERSIEEMIDLFVRAIVMSKRLGFDAVQLHGAHGYVLSDFLSPARNGRDDRWGGSTENRFRVIAEIFRRARKMAGNYPILIKINAYDNRRNGMRVEEAVRIARLLESSGCAGIEVSCGVMDDGFSTVRVTEVPVDALVEFSKYRRLPSPIKAVMPAIVPFIARRFEPLENYNVAAAREIAGAVSIPVIAVGGIRNRGDINAILESGAADFVSMGRPFIIEPDIVNRLRKGPGSKSACINCGYCIMAANSTEVRCFYGTL